ncbi:MAG: hypothetical protein LLG09_00100 [Negativicutes bacterium]|nr:hypothetical protein [Negativicutes bacterium]
MLLDDRSVTICRYLEITFDLNDLYREQYEAMAEQESLQNFDLESAVDSLSEAKIELIGILAECNQLSDEPAAPQEADEVLQAMIVFQELLLRCSFNFLEFLVHLAAKPIPAGNSYADYLGRPECRELTRLEEMGEKAFDLLEELAEPFMVKWQDVAEQNGEPEQTAQDEEDFSDTKPNELTGYNDLVTALEEIFGYYLKNRRDERISEFWQKLAHTLEHFGEGQDNHEIFAFSFVLHATEGLKYIDFYLDIDSIEVSSGGYLFDAKTGGDAYTDWLYNVWNNGREVNAVKMADLANLVIMMINLGVEISIELPEKFADPEEKK